MRTPHDSLGRRGQVQKIAHRGSRGEGLPENSTAAFKDACKSGAEVLEVDRSQPTYFDEDIERCMKHMHAAWSQLLY